MKLKLGKVIAIKANSKRELDNAVYQFILANPNVEFKHEMRLKKTWRGKWKWILKIEITKV
ncbi:hypothetical protein MZV44_002988 [Listeria monocytogenes]|uniref:hypothetical protein n=1 Tax=Listeria monocytogenes TaxID=1639 RepID=UPI0010D8CCC6|nr:hypothetical protein [Listeria monocytogenes]EAC8001171.1 hypothetical protein [Listeria monocytogenes]EJC6460057.1 hypothetical protein [Listeria monocytogenes]TYU82184.1 hypothetical protein FZX01_15960 [Listeria monocytogenes]